MEFPNLQPVSQGGKLHEQMPVETAADLSLIFNSQSNAGDQVEMFFSIAESKPETALISFSTVVRNLTSPPIKSLALQGFGRIPSPLKQKLASCVSQESQDLLKLLCNEIKSRKSDLTTWAAAEALREAGFSLDNIQHPQGGNLSEPPRRIQNEVLDRKIREIKTVRRLDSRGEFTAEYERFLEFWIYGPTSKFFNEKSTASSYMEIAKDILRFTQLRGIHLGLNATNKKVQEEALAQIKLVFKRYSATQGDEFKGALGNSLKRFLKEVASKDDDLRRLVAAFAFELQAHMLPSDKELTQQTVSEIENTIALLKQYSLQISVIFSSAISVSGELTLNQFLEIEKNKHVSLVKSWMERSDRQIGKMTALSISYNANVYLLASILQSIQRHDQDFCYTELQGDVSSSVRRLAGLTATTQEEYDQANAQLNTLKDSLSSSLRKKIGTLETDYRKLTKSVLEDKKEAGATLKNAAIWLTVGVLAEVIVGFLVVIIIFMGLGAAGGGG
ncbi:hypothetical protein [Phormidesmis sp. 146-33]